MSEWISVEIAYPAPWTDILCYKPGYVPKVMTFDGKSNWTGFTHWMPLPELPDA